MDSLIIAAARALAMGDPVGALKRIALREDAPALALRGTAMAQLGDFTRAKSLLRQAARAYGAREALARARCVVAQAEVALACRDLIWPSKALSGAASVLQAHGDRTNAAHARYLEIRRWLLLGRLEAAEDLLEQLNPRALPPVLQTVHQLAIAGIAMRRLQSGAARRALTAASVAARRAGIPALTAEVEIAAAALTAPAARLIQAGSWRELRLEQVEALLSSRTLIVDACRLSVREASTGIDLRRRPVLFTLARQLAEAWPADVAREALARTAFRARHLDDTYRARLRVEIGRLRKLLATYAKIVSTQRGFLLSPHRARSVAVLALPVEAQHAAVLALMADGESWSSSALALALGSSSRTVQRSLDSLSQAGKVQALGRGRARRWISAPLAGIATALLLPVPLA